jgi:hypothetical protein
MRARRIALLVATVWLLVACGAPDGTVTLVGAPAVPDGPVVPQDVAEPVPEASVPVADVNEEAEAVNSGDLDQARGVTMRRDAGPADAADVSDTALAGGCVVGYGGDESACLPPVPPRLAARHRDHGGMDPKEMTLLYTCEDVRDLIPAGIGVNTVADGVGQDGVDPIGLDSDGDGTACGEGDD